MLLLILTCSTINLRVDFKLMVYCSLPSWMHELKHKPQNMKINKLSCGNIFTEINVNIPVGIEKKLNISLTATCFFFKELFDHRTVRHKIFS